MKFQDFSLLEQGDECTVLIQMKSIWKNIIAMRDWEFLGDAVLELVSSEFLFLESPKYRKES